MIGRSQTGRPYFAEMCGPLFKDFYYLRQKCYGIRSNVEDFFPAGGKSERSCCVCLFC